MVPPMPLITSSIMSKKTTARARLRANTPVELRPSFSDIVVRKRSKIRDLSGSPHNAA
jgi:hypothetical protein